MDAGVFSNVPISASNSKLCEISKAQFYQALVDAMTARLLPEDEKKLSIAVSMLDSTSFSDDMPPEFGESDVRLL